jgi:TPR repeat protein
MRIAAAHASEAAATLRAAAASRDPDLQAEAIKEALVRIWAASEYFWGRPAERCAHIARCLEEGRGVAGDPAAATGLQRYAAALEDLWLGASDPLAGS